MNIIVQSKTFAVTEALRAFVEKHVTRLFRKRGRISQVVVYLESVPKKKNDLFSTSAKIYIDVPGKNIVVQEKAADLYLAISQAAQSAARQLRKTKERRATHGAKWAWNLVPDYRD
ncbi:ribosome-associated translation inhibitor RaiA [Patescibacteria group bacterium]|nr:ribosome-associated translation inhibitor RaiA [Patescibacteria group bacterium]